MLFLCYDFLVERSWTMLIITCLPTLHIALLIGDVILCTSIQAQPRSQGLSSLPPFVVGTETLVAAVTWPPRIWVVEKSAGRVRQQGGILSSSRPNVLEYPPSLWFWMERWSRDQPQPWSLFQRLSEAEKREPGNELGYKHLRLQKPWQ